MFEISEFRIDNKRDSWVGNKKPEFSWILQSEDNIVFQQKTKLLIYLVGEHGNKLYWNCVISDCTDSNHIVYGGESLLEEQEYIAELQVWDKENNVAKKQICFQTSLFDGKGFKANWITYSGKPVDEPQVFFNELQIEKKIKKATAYASACGIYRLSINGKKVGDEFLAPGWTEYKERIQFQTHDVTAFLKEKQNKFEMTVAKGWYSGEYSWVCMPNIYGDKVAAFLEIHIEYADGSKTVFGTDQGWKSSTGMDRFAEIYHGQTIDHTYQNDFSADVEITELSSEILIPQENSPIQAMEKRKAIEFIITPKGEKVLDFGQNFAGTICAQTDERKGTKIVVKYAETLDGDGNFYTNNLRNARATDTFICAGGKETFLPDFTYHGFRYVLIEGIENVQIEDFTAYVLYSGMEENCSFHCNNELVNRLYQNIIWGEKSNFLDVPTDCPQRDERLGWTGDAGIFSQTAAINMDVQQFFRKWMKDVAIAQKEIGTVPAVVPNILGAAASGGAVWSDCVTLIPWNMYQIYGDKKILFDQYESMRSWVESLIERENSDHLIDNGFQYGDWLALDKEECIPETWGITDHTLIASVFYAVSTKILANTSLVIGRDVEAEKYSQLYKQIKHAINAEFITSTGRIVSDSETAYAIMFYFDMIEEQHEAKMKELFVKNIEKHHNKLSTGFVGTPFLCYALHKIGRDDLAGKIILTEECPGWLYAVKMGATTIWERWDSKDTDGNVKENGMNSLNHYAYGSVGSYLVEIVAGITAIEPGYKSICIEPNPLKTLTEVSVKQKTKYGNVSCSYKWDNYQFTVDVEIPVNTSAEILLPEWKNSIHVESGKYHYSYLVSFNLEEDRYNNEMKIEELLSDPVFLETMKEYPDDVLEGIRGVSGFTIAEACGMVADFKPLFEEVLVKLNS